MPDHFPKDLQTGGIVWFPDLIIANLYVMMAVLSAMTLVATIKLTKGQMMSNVADPVQGRMITNVFCGLGLFMIPVVYSFPSIIFVYWMTNNVFPLFLTVVFQSRPIRKYFGIWKLLKPVPGASKGKGVKVFMEEIMNKRVRRNRWRMKKRGLRN